MLLLQQGGARREEGNRRAESDRHLRRVCAALQRDLNEPGTSNTESVETPAEASMEPPPSLEQAARDLKRLVDCQEQLVLEQRAFQRRYADLFALLLQEVDAAEGANAD